MNIVIAINNEKIFKELKNKNDINIISGDILYKEGILEILEKYKNINYVIINEKLNGQIQIEELIKKIYEINNKIKLIIILSKKDIIKEEYLLKNKIKFIYIEEISAQTILETIFNKNKIIGITGCEGSGKTITTIILSKLIINYKNKKILIVEDNIKNNSIHKTYKPENNEKNIKDNIIKLKDNLYLLNVKKILNKNKRIINEIYLQKNNYDYIFVDMQNIYTYKIYQEVLDDVILIVNPNILDINKIKKFVIYNKIKLKIILNNNNINSISEKILNNIFKNKINIIAKIENSLNYNLIINNNFNIKYLDKKTLNIYFNIIKNI